MSIRVSFVMTPQAMVDPASLVQPILSLSLLFPLERPRVVQDALKRQ